MFRLLCAIVFSYLLALSSLRVSYGQASAPAPSAPALSEAEAYRSSPRYTVEKFLELTQAGDFESASLFFDWNISSGKAGDLAKKLKLVIDRKGFVNPSTISSSPDGDLENILNPDLEKVGEIRMSSTAYPIVLKRVQGEAPQWRFDRSFLKEVPSLYTQITEDELSDLLPQWMSRLTLGPLWFWQWLGLIVFSLLSLGLGFLFIKILFRVFQWLPLVKKQEAFQVTLTETLLPVQIFATIGIFNLCQDWLELPLVVRHRISYGEIAVSVFAALLLGLRFADGISLLWQNFLVRSHHGNALSMVPLLRKSLKIGVCFLATLMILKNFGFDVSAVIAGLGVGGIAVALAGQKTIENLFGGATLILDQPVRVGDFCQFGGTKGHVEDIGLRSTRIRTLDRTVISIPNAEFSHMQIENYARREKMLMQTVLGIHPETSAENMRILLAQLKELMLGHAMVDKAPLRVRFINVTRDAFEIEFFVYIRTVDQSEYLAVKEDLYLHILETVKACGVSLAPSSNTVILSPSEK